MVLCRISTTRDWKESACPCPVKVVRFEQSGRLRSESTVLHLVSGKQRVLIAESFHTLLCGWGANHHPLSRRFDHHLSPLSRCSGLSPTAVVWYSRLTRRPDESPPVAKFAFDPAEIEELPLLSRVVLSLRQCVFSGVLEKRSALQCQPSFPRKILGRCSESKLPKDQGSVLKKKFKKIETYFQKVQGALACSWLYFKFCIVFVNWERVSALGDK